MPEAPRPPMPVVLVVEDEVTIATMLERAMQELNFTVLGPVGRLAQALQVAQNARFDMALLDVNLRGEKVFPLADFLAERGIPFAFLTGYGRDSLPPRFAQAVVLCKPFNFTELSEAASALQGAIA